MINDILYLLTMIGLPAFFSIILPVLIFYFIFSSIRKSFLRGDISLSSSVFGVFLFVPTIHLLFMFVCNHLYQKTFGVESEWGATLYIFGTMFLILPVTVITLSVFSFFSLKKIQKDVVMVATEPDSFTKKYFKYLLVIAMLSPLLFTGLIAVYSFVINLFK